MGRKFVAFLEVIAVLVTTCISKSYADDGCFWKMFRNDVQRSKFLCLSGSLENRSGVRLGGIQVREELILFINQNNYTFFS